jgi:alpha-ketoglutarate-dependent taurine dioxygenase
MSLMNATIWHACKKTYSSNQRHLYGVLVECDHFAHLRPDSGMDH